METKNNISPQDWKETHSNIVADCRVFKVAKQHFVHPDGRAGDFYVNQSPDWVQTAALVNAPEGLSIVLVNQFRFGVKRTSWELPGGIVEAGEKPEIAAARELLEETGFAGDTPILAASYSPNPAIQNNLAHFVVIENCKKIGALNWDANEEIETKLVPVSQLDKLIRDGKIFHAIAIDSVYFLQKFLAPKAENIA